MFENLSFDSSLQDESGLESMVDGTFMENSSHDLTYDGRNYMLYLSNDYVLIFQKMEFLY